MLGGILLGAAAVVGALMLLQGRQSAARGDRRFILSSISGFLIVGAVVTIVIDTRSEESAGEAPALAGISLDELARVSSSFGNSRSAIEQAQMQAGKVAPVPSLISGLEQRLESDPDDARGWALLAQSYAFLGRGEDSEEALNRAVELGLDERNLRDRVAVARRDPHAGIPGAPKLD